MMPRKSHIVVIMLLSVIAFISCGTSEKKGVEVTENLNKSGQELMMTNCVTCHSPTAGMDNRLAPPMIAIKRQYIGEGVTAAQFTSALTTFLLDPTEERSKMPGAVKKFGLMAKLGYTEAQIKDVADYIYHANIEQPDWFEKHYEETHGGTDSEGAVEAEPPTDLGLQYALATKAILGKNLMNQITTNGTESALSFCNTKAIHLTDSMAVAQSAQIKRVSDRPRNPDNRANVDELDYIKTQKARMANGDKPLPKRVELDGHTLGYYPIMTNAMCLQCHGIVGETIEPKVETRIKELYPKDEATGYKADELRGIWVVEMQDGE